MRDEIRDNPRLLVVLLVTGVTAIVIFAIFMLILVWSPKEKSETTKNNTTHQLKDLKLGNYRMAYTDEKAVVEQYCKEILNTFAGADTNLINNIILPEYLTFRGIDKSSLDSSLRQKGLLGKMLQFSSYKVVNHPKYGKIFEVSIASYDGTYSDKMLIIQKSPNDYKVSFDGFIGLDRNTRSFTIEGVKLDISEIKELATSVSMKIKLTNVSGHNIIVNKENNYENIYLQLTTGTELRMSSTWLAGETKELTNGYIVNLNTEFITSGLASGMANKIIIKNVYDSISKETKDIVFSINL